MSSFVLGFEVSIGALLIVSTVPLFVYNRRRFFLFTVIVGGVVSAAFLLYRTKPNPYEFTHLPEYAILNILIIKAMKGGKRTPIERVTEMEERMATHRATGVGESLYRYLYFRALAITGAIGAIDELYQGLLPTRYFNVYDMLLNGLGGALGSAIIWGMDRD